MIAAMRLPLGSVPSPRMNATRPAEAMLDKVLIERVRADGLVRCQQVQLFARHKPQERSLAGTHRAIARRRAIELAFYFEGNFPAVTATLVSHVSSPWRFLVYCVPLSAPSVALPRSTGEN